MRVTNNEEEEQSTPNAGRGRPLCVVCSCSFADRAALDEHVVSCAKEHGKLRSPFPPRPADCSSAASATRKELQQRSPNGGSEGRTCHEAAAMPSDAHEIGRLLASELEDVTAAAVATPPDTPPPLGTLCRSSSTSVGSLPSTPLPDRTASQTASSSVSGVASPSTSSRRRAHRKPRMCSARGSQAAWADDKLRSLSELQAENKHKLERCNSAVTLGSSASATSTVERHESFRRLRSQQSADAAPPQPSQHQGRRQHGPVVDSASSAQPPTNSPLSPHVASSSATSMEDEMTRDILERVKRQDQFASPKRVVSFVAPVARHQAEGSPGAAIATSSQSVEQVVQVPPVSSFADHSPLRNIPPTAAAAPSGTSSAASSKQASPTEARGSAGARSTSKRSASAAAETDGACARHASPKQSAVLERAKTSTKSSSTQPTKRSASVVEQRFRVEAGRSAPSAASPAAAPATSTRTVASGGRPAPLRTRLSTTTAAAGRVDLVGAPASAAARAATATRPAPASRAAAPTVVSRQRPAPSIAAAHARQGKMSNDAPRASASRLAALAKPRVPPATVTVSTSAVVSVPRQPAPPALSRSGVSAASPLSPTHVDPAKFLLANCPPATGAAGSVAASNSSSVPPPPATTSSLPGSAGGSGSSSRRMAELATAVVPVSFCADCGKKYLDGARFCAFCGHRREDTSAVA